MGHLKMAYKAYKFKEGMEKVKQAKINAERARQGLPPIRPWYEDCYINCTEGIRDTIMRAFCPCCIYDRERHLKQQKGSNNVIGRLLIDGTYENDLLKSIFGFMSGVALTYLMLWFMIEYMKMTVFASTICAIIAAIILCGGLAFSLNVRCVVLLMLPGIFSSKGRALLLTYVFVLVMTGPVQNFTHNVRIMSESSTCGQEVAYNLTKEVVKESLSPVHGIIDAIRNVIQGMMNLAEALRKAFLAVVQVFAEVGAAIKRVFAWIGAQVNVCNEAMGEPYAKCTESFDSAYTDCKEKLGVFDFLCEIPKAFRGICNIARIGELLCHIMKTVKKFFVDEVGGRINKAVHDVYEMFYVNVTLVYHYNLTTEQTKSFTDIRDDILAEVRSRTDTMMKVLNIANTAMAFMILWLFVKAILYRKKYLTQDKFDNFYLTFNLRDIDERREEMEKETILPLKGREKWTYIKTWSVFMAKPEKRKLVKGIIMLIGSSMHVMFYMFCDYGLYHILWLIQNHTRMLTEQPIPGRLRMHVDGKGVLADMYRELITTFDPMSKDTTERLEAKGCLPNASAPDYKLYQLISSILSLCFVLVIVEAYGLRLRHVIAGCYFPQREKQRAVWLYNHILRCRGGLLFFIRRQLRRKYMGDTTVKKHSIKSRLSHQFPLIGKLMKCFGYERKFCLSCGAPGKLSDYEGFKHCDNQDCDAVYCNDCFEELNNICTVCMKPVDYGDYSDFSEERDSSDEEFFYKAEMPLEDEDYEYQKHRGEGNDCVEEYVYERTERIASKKSVLSVVPQPKELVSMDLFAGDNESDFGDYDEEDLKNFEEPKVMSLGKEERAMISSDHH
ncbi:unnamed protein product [Owenia fusiformis]|uniref:Dendritic cell-specific transmembrane protein-like domain-containing protein n=1 Tax=Owenia fusiformis TaxID=6347 RepID=A0A8J1TTF6_OWEFU|nr:unnamed protein product [Owenia fusiformis]